MDKKSLTRTLDLLEGQLGQADDDMKIFGEQLLACVHRLVAHTEGITTKSMTPELARVVSAAVSEFSYRADWIVTQYQIAEVKYNLCESILGGK